MASTRKSRCVVALEDLEPRRFLSAAAVNLQITTDPGTQQQPTIAVDPHHAQHLALAYMDYSLLSTGFAGIRISSSNDGGKSWTRSSIPLPAGFEQGAANPVAQFDDQGHLFVSFMAATFLGAKPPLTNPSGADSAGVQLRTYGFRANNGIFVARSDDGGNTWNAPVAVASHRYDRNTEVPFDIMPDLAIDTNPSSLHYGMMYLVWSRYFPNGQFPGDPGSRGGSQLQMSVSSDGGKTFQARPYIRDSSSETPKPAAGLVAGLGVANWVHVAVGPEGFVYVGFYDFGNFIVVHSEDAGRSFDQHIAAAIAANHHIVFGNAGEAADPLAGGSLARFPGFRTQVTRNVVPDPSRPGTVYAAESMFRGDQLGNEIDSDYAFATSHDNSLNFSTYKVREHPGAVNDDNDGIRVHGKDSDVNARQFFTRLASDSNGDLVAVWYDTRRDPDNEMIDVFGSVSRDGGKTWSRNFRITNQSFNLEDAKFIDATGLPSYYLGDFIGLSVADGIAYVAWDDTGGGNQNVAFSSFPISDPPAPDNDRYEPNQKLGSATDLGPIVQRVIPKLSVGRGDSDVFSFTTRASGILTVDLTQSGTGDRTRMELIDSKGVSVLAISKPTKDSSGITIGQRLTFASKSNQQYFLRVRSINDRKTSYSLNLKALTGDLGTLARQTSAGNLARGDQNYFSFATAASGSVQVKLTTDSRATGSLVLELLDPRTLEVLATATSKNLASLTVKKGQTLTARVRGKDDGSSGLYTLRFTNLDSFATGDRSGLLFPAGAGPSQIQSGDVNNDGADDLVVTNGLSDTVSVLLSNRDGTFQAPRQFAVGAFHPGTDLGGMIPTFRRDLVLGDFDGDRNLDIAVANTHSSDISILLGRGDGTFQPQRRFDATTYPFGIDTGDLNHDGILDLAVIELSRTNIEIAVLLGRGDGTFRHETLISTGIPGGGLGITNSDIKIADFNRDGNQDLIYTGGLNARTSIRLGTGDGINYRTLTTHTGKEKSFNGGGPSIALGDLNGDGNLDLANATLFSDAVYYSFGNGNGIFLDSQDGSQTFTGGQSPVDIQIADIASLNENGTLGAADGLPDIITVASGFPQTAFQGPAEITVSAGIRNQDGSITFGNAIHLAGAVQPLGLTLGDFNADGRREIAFADQDGVRLIFNHEPNVPPNSSRASARNLGTVVHLLQPTLTVVPGRDDAWYSLNMPAEAAHGSGDEIVDVSGLFTAQRGAGLDMQIVDQNGNLLGTGEHVRLRAKQAERLYIHVSGKADSSGVRGSGAYTLDIAVLPQLAFVEASSLLPGANNSAGGPTTSLVLTFQGDRLNQALSEDPANYTVTWLGPDGVPGGNDDQVIPVHATDARPVVYNPSANVDVSSGRTYPTAVRQTITLLFTSALPSGAYRIEVSPTVQSASFNESESPLIGDRHPVVMMNDRLLTEGASMDARNLVPRVSVDDHDLSAFEAGTPFLSQLHGDLGAILDQRLTASGDAAASQITREILNQMIACMQAGVSRFNKSLVALFLDPVGIDLTTSNGSKLSYSLESGALSNQISDTFVSVASNVELVVVPMDAGTLNLNVDDVPASARGGAIIFNDEGVQLSQSLTAELQRGQDQFRFTVQGNTANTPDPKQPTDPIIMRPEVDPAASAQPAQKVLTLTITLQTQVVVPSTPTAISGSATATRTTRSYGMYPRTTVIPTQFVVGRFLQTISHLVKMIRGYLPVLLIPNQHATIPADPPADLPNSTPHASAKPSTQPASKAPAGASAPTQSHKQSAQAVPRISEISGRRTFRSVVLSVGMMALLVPVRGRVRRRCRRRSAAIRASLG